MLLMTLFGSACSRPQADDKTVPDPDVDLHAPAAEAKTMAAVFAGGCFWCAEAVFEQLEGVSDVVAGYAGGSADSANYQAVSSGSSEHAEVIRITFDSSKITYGQLLKVFFTVAHDPT